MTKDKLITQSQDYIRLQKYRSSLIASGSAMALFAVWTVLRSMVEIDAELSAVGNSKAFEPLVTLMAVSGVIELVMKLYVGLSARQEGVSRKRKRPYLGLGIYIAAMSVIWVAYMIFEFPEMYKAYGLIYPVVTLAVEATVLYASLDLVISAIKARRLEKEIGRT